MTKEVCVMKKYFLILCAVLLCFAFGFAPAARAAGVVNYALYTDIAAKINGHAIRSYNIDGYTAVPAEDLRGYGFAVIWNESERTLKVNRAVKDGSLEMPYRWPDYAAPPLEKRVGTRAKAVYATDIVTYIAGERTESFNIDGETLVWIDDLAPFGSVVWDEESRVIELTLGDPVEIALTPLIDWQWL